MRYGATNFGAISRTVWPNATNCRAQWWAPEHASMPITHGGVGRRMHLRLFVFGIVLLSASFPRACEVFNPSKTTMSSSHQLEVLEFNGLGQPKNQMVASGTVALLWEEGAVSIVRINILPPDQYGPELDHATNEAELRGGAELAVKQGTTKLDISRHWVFRAPLEIAEKARFITEP
jgi:hypothetical protein